MSKKCFFCEHERPPREQPDICKACKNHNKFLIKRRMSECMRYEWEKFRKDEEWVNDPNVEFDRDTALMVLKDLSNCMYPGLDIFGNKTLVIRRERFELVRRKYLDRKDTKI